MVKVERIVIVEGLVSGQRYNGWWSIKEGGNIDIDVAELDWIAEQISDEPIIRLMWGLVDRSCNVGRESAYDSKEDALRALEAGEYQRFEEIC